MDRIVYLSPEGDLRTVTAQDKNPLPLLEAGRAAGQGGGVKPRPLDLNTGYAWPTWSPQGAQVAASRLRVSGNEVDLSVQVIDAATGRSRSAYTNDAPGMVADGTPHYLYWSPDGRAIAVLAAAPQGLTLWVQELEASASGEPVRVAAGAPLFFHWHPEGRALLLHHGEEVVLAPRPFHRTDTRQLLAAGDAFRVASFAPGPVSGGRRMAYVAPGPGDTNYLVTAEVASGLARRVVEVGPQAAFLWSPNGRELAVADQEAANTPAYSRLRIVSAEGGPARTLAAETLLAFFWSPDGRRIAWVALDVAEQRFLWKAASTQAPAEPEPAPFFSFQPASQVLTMLQFFDQYACSHSLWSPDSARLVVAGAKEPVASRRNGHTPTGDRIWLLDPSGTQAPVDLAAGTLAFWSWQ